MIISHKNALALSMYHFPILVPLSIPIKLSHKLWHRNCLLTVLITAVDIANATFWVMQALYPLMSGSVIWSRVMSS